MTYFNAKSIRGSIPVSLANTFQGNDLREFSNPKSILKEYRQIGGLNSDNPYKFPGLSSFLQLRIHLESAE
ncbi:MAG TPA: hypothetical protein DIW81_08880 [Planctomycetaceae bacterium]|nr:hypothetical protein [Rubinisphaera sp.]HCS51690.1 hypothetical protein [Planctomycetaceae bacterium]